MLKPTLFVLVALFIVVGFIAKIALPRLEQRECVVWQEQSREYALYQSADWQVEQCDNYGIHLEK